ILVPVLAKDVLKLGATGYGLMMSFMGGGALLGAMTLASFAHLGPQRKLLYAGAIALGAFEIIQAIPSSFIMACIILFLSGWAQITYSATANSSLQVNTPNHLRGRVMSLYSFLNQGSSPLGNLFAGTATDLYGAPGGFVVCGAATLISIGLVLWIGRHSATAMRQVSYGSN
ncbi:MAG: MFS transporter, partial [Bacillota bacterium]